MSSALVYIVTKGRWDSRMTHKILCKMQVPHLLVVEAQEIDQYAAVIDHTWGTIIELDRAYQTDYDTCDDLGDTKSKGPGPARNFAWDHAISAGARWHWVMDDNIRVFMRLHANRKIHVYDRAIFHAMQDFADRYENVAMAGPNYDEFAKRKQPINPIILNTRIYSCNLIRTDVPFRWRGRYNEDTILSVDMLKAGWCTVQFNAFLQDKGPTQVLPGGNTDAFYRAEGTLPKSRMMVDVHPDCSRLVWKFKRWHHHVDYRRFRGNQLIRRDGLEIDQAPNDYGMKLVRR